MSGNQMSTDIKEVNQFRDCKTLSEKAKYLGIEIIVLENHGQIAYCGLRNVKKNRFYVNSYLAPDLEKIFEGIYAQICENNLDKR